ncbi:macro domain-containing protein [Tissierella praeacuta]|uniref:macro domain-containing protein n=1 Tax=Tissierella praeacuta TaxID=43131 RepID=UPI003DA37090
MILKEEKRDLFTIDDKYYLAHCISSDCAMGAGIAVEFEKRFKLRRELLKNGWLIRQHPTCILRGRVFNLITKEEYWHKPTYNSLNSSLNIMRSIAEVENIKHIAMPKIGSGLDKLQWAKVKEMIEDIFDDSDIEILVCSI